MAILTFKPHRLQRATLNEGYEDELGDWHVGTVKWGDVEKCDIVQAGAASERKFADGIVRTYSYTVYMDRTAKSLKAGDVVRLSMFGGDWQEFTVLGFQRLQLQCKLWV